MSRPSPGAAGLPSGLRGRAHHLPATGVAVVAVALLAGLPELLGDFGRLAAVLVLQLGWVLAWVLVTGIQGFAGSLAVGAAAAVAADLALVLPERPELGGVLVVFGLGFVAVVIGQMVRRPRTDLVASLSGALVMICAVGALGALLLLGRSGSGPDRTQVAVLAIGTALVVGHLVDLVLPRPQLAPEVPRGLVGLLAAVLAGAGVTLVVMVTDGLSGAVTALFFGAVLAVVAALVALAASYVVVEATAAGQPSPWALAVVQVVLPLAACSPVALALQEAL